MYGRLENSRRTALAILLTAIIGIPMGVTHWDRIVSTPPSIAPVFLKFEWTQIFSWDMLIVVFTFLFVDFFDTVGTVIGVSTKAHMVDKNGHVQGVGRMLMTDAVATTAGACLGASSCISKNHLPNILQEIQFSANSSSVTWVLIPNANSLTCSIFIPLHKSVRLL
jgi:hypothetical protein